MMSVTSPQTWRCLASDIDENNGIYTCVEMIDMKNGDEIYVIDTEGLGSDGIKVLLYDQENKCLVPQ